MPVPAIPGVPPFATHDDLVSIVTKMRGELVNLLLNLDSLNVVELTADHITAGTIDASIITIRSDLTGGAYIQIDVNGMVINDGTADTFKADITGHVTMTGATVQSKNGTYPFVIMDPDNDLFGAYTSATESIVINAFDGITTRPFVEFLTGTASTTIDQSSSDFTIESGVNIDLHAPVTGSHIYLRPDGFVQFQDWDKPYNFTANETLQDVFTDFQSQIDLINLSKADIGSSTSTDGLHNHGIPDGTVLMVNGGGTVTFSASGDHSHTLT